MIAVFCKTERDFYDLRATPKSEFVRINSEEDIRGKTFKGVIIMYKGISGKERIQSYELLEKNNQNYLSNNKKI